MRQIRSGNWFRLKIKPPSPHLYSFIPFHSPARADSCAGGCVSTARSRGGAGGRQQWQGAGGGCCSPELVLNSSSYRTVASVLALRMSKVRTASRRRRKVSGGFHICAGAISKELGLAIWSTLGKCLKPIVWNDFKLTLLGNLKLVWSRWRK